MLIAQAAVHRMAGTAHLSGGLVVSFFLAALASAFTCYAMRRGAMLGGVEETTVRQDMKVLPRITLDFLFAAPRIIGKAFRARG